MKPTENMFISVDWLNWELYKPEERIPGDTKSNTNTYTEWSNIHLFFLLKTCKQSIYVKSETEERKKQLIPNL